MRRVTTKPMSSKNAIVALRSVTRIIVCRYSMSSSSGFASLMASEHNAFGIKGKPPGHMGLLALETEPGHPPENHSKLKQRAAAASTAASTVLAALKLAAGFASGSLALISEGAHNTIDIGASALTLFAVREADKHADADHPFGHAKIEAVAALAETGLLAALSIGVAIQAIERIRTGDAMG